jgi:hypothetical protein
VVLCRRGAAAWCCARRAGGGPPCGGVPGVLLRGDVHGTRNLKLFVYVFITPCDYYVLSKLLLCMGVKLGLLRHGKTYCGLLDCCIACQHFGGTWYLRCQG